MSSVGKRIIWVGPADGANAKPLNIEGLALAAVLPGTLVRLTATGIQSNAQAATIFGELTAFADKDQQRTRSVDDAWTINENMVAIQPRSGEFMNVLVADGNNITRVGTGLARNGAGRLKIALTDGTEEIVAYSDEIINVSGADALVRVRTV